MTTPNTATPTAARTKPQGGGHWYDLDGTPRYEVQRADGSGMRATTLADARKNNWLPSVTTILKILHKEQLVRWMVEQAALAVLTAPRKDKEELDAFVRRVLQEEQQQEQEAAKARDLGKDIHDALECYFSGEPVPVEMEVYVRPVIDTVLQFGEKASSEVVLVGDDYAGITDLIQDCSEAKIWRLWDFKSAKTMPDPRKGGAWSEHRLQLSAYAKAFQDKLIRAGSGLKPIIVGNIYISTVKPGEYVVCEHEDWEGTYERGFKPLVQHWQWVNRYRPENPNRTEGPASPESELAGALAEAGKENARLRMLIESFSRAQDERAKGKGELPPPDVTPVQNSSGAMAVRFNQPPAAPSDKPSYPIERVLEMQAELGKLRSNLEETVKENIALKGKQLYAAPKEPQPAPAAPAAQAAPQPPGPKPLPATIGGKKVTWSTSVAARPTD